MRRHHHHHHYHHHDESGPGCGRSRGRGSGHCGPIGRVIRGLAERFGIGRHVVIAGFVLGFVFVPVLAALVFVGALIWVDNPEKVERRFDRVADKVREVYRDHMTGGARANEAPRERPGAPEPPPVPPTAEVPDFPELRRRFEELETRAGRMEACVASREFELNREFKGIGG